MNTVWNEDEDEALQGLPLGAQVLYLRGIRRYMDYQTGFVGIKRGISLQSLSETLYVEPAPGFNKVKFSRDQIKRLIFWLVKAGLVERHSIERKSLIFFLPLADTDQSVQNKAATKPPQSRHSKAAPKAATAKASNSNGFNHSADTEADPTSKKVRRPIAATPPVSGIRNNTSTDVEVLLLSAHDRKAATAKTNNHKGCSHNPATEKPKKTLIPLQILSDFGINGQLAADFLEIRKAKKSPLTLTALNCILKQAEKAGLALEDAIRICIERNWQTFNANWDWNPIKKPLRKTPAEQSEDIFRAIYSDDYTTVPFFKPN